MKKVLCSVIMCFVVCAVFAEESGSKDSVLSVRSVYQKSLDKINSDAFARSLEWTLSYKTALETHLAARQKEGDLDGWRAAKTELDRFLQTKEILPDSLVDATNPLNAIQKAHLKSKSDLIQDHNSQIVSLTDNYCQHLLSKQTSLTKAGNIEEAIAFNEELKRTKENEVYVKAKADLVQKETTDAPAQSIAEKPDKPEAPSAEPDKTPESDFPPGFNVYKQSERSTKEKTGGTTYKPLPLRSSGKVLRNEGLGCNVDMSKDSTSSKSSAYYAGNVTANTRAVKLTLKRTLSDASLSNLMIIIQYYSKAVGENSKDLFDTQVIRIPSFEKEPLIIECPEFSLSKSVSTARGKSGSEFYGLMVSVFDPNTKKLLYQGVSTASLSEYGDTVLGEADKMLAKQKVDILYKTFIEARDNRRGPGGIVSSVSPEYKAYIAASAAYQSAVTEYNTAFPDSPYIPPYTPPAPGVLP